MIRHTIVCGSETLGSPANTWINHTYHKEMPGWASATPSTDYLTTSFDSYITTT